MQTTVSQYNSGVLPGTLGSRREDATIDTVTAAEVIPFGVLVEIDSNGKAILPKGTGANLGTVGGLSLRQEVLVGGTYAPGGAAAYQIGDSLPVLRRGRAYAAVDANGTIALYAAANVNHSSTTATSRGKFTAAATASTTGSEVGAAPAVFCGPASNGAALVSLNLA